MELEVQVYKQVEALLLFRKGRRIIIKFTCMINIEVIPGECRSDSARTNILALYSAMCEIYSIRKRVTYC